MADTLKQNHKSDNNNKKLAPDPTAAESATGSINPCYSFAQCRQNQRTLL